MTANTETINRNPLLPDRHPEPDFFICDIFDAAPKSDMASMEHPLFTLSTKPDMTLRSYDSGDRWLKVSPSSIGLATVHDRDVLIYCISQCMAGLNRGKSISKTLRFNAHDLLKTTNRATNSRGYKLLSAALKRLQGTQIETNITTGGKEQWDVFSFIDKASIIKETRDGRMQAIEITLSEWIFNAIEEKGGEILTISKDYFRLRRPLERRLYELARKCCGRSPKQLFKLETLRQRTGSNSTPEEFKRMMKQIIKDNADHNHIPDYTFELDGNLVVIRPKREFTDVYEKNKRPSAIDQVKLKPRIHEAAKKFASRWDTHSLESDWRLMLADKNEIPKNPEGSFIGYVKWRVKKDGNWD